MFADATPDSMLRSLLIAATIACSRADFTVQFDVVTTDGPGSFQVLVHEDWAPIGAARFRELVEAKFYDDTRCVAEVGVGACSPSRRKPCHTWRCRFFRVIPPFMVQYGLNGDPEVSSSWRAKTITDEPVKVSNKPGYMTVAKTGAPNSRTTQVRRPTPTP